MPDSTPLLRPPPLLTGRRRAEPGKLGPPRLLKSAGFRFAVLFAAMFASAAIALVAVLWWATAGALDRQTDVAIRADAVALSERWREAGPNAVAESIEERLSVDVENEAIYLLMDAGGAVRLAGNIEASALIDTLRTAIQRGSRIIDQILRSTRQSTADPARTQPSSHPASSTANPPKGSKQTRTVCTAAPAQRPVARLWLGIGEAPALSRAAAQATAMPQTNPPARHQSQSRSGPAQRRRARA